VLGPWRTRALAGSGNPHGAQVAQHRGVPRRQHGLLVVTVPAHGGQRPQHGVAGLRDRAAQLRRDGQAAG
jgi:hypothetical protein